VEQPVATLTVLCGPPAAGKSTYVARLTAGPVVLSADRGATDPEGWRLELVRAAFRHLEAGHDVVVDACNVTQHHRLTWLAVGRRTGSRCVLVVMRTPWRVCERRNAARTRGERVPASVMVDYRRRWGPAWRAAAAEPWDERTEVWPDGHEPTRWPTVRHALLP
jgi:predicted kinase